MIDHDESGCGRDEDDRACQFLMSRWGIPEELARAIIALERTAFSWSRPLDDDKNFPTAA
jgi:hypothetical protein